MDEYEDESSLIPIYHSVNRLIQLPDEKEPTTIPFELEMTSSALQERWDHWISTISENCTDVISS